MSSQRTVCDKQGLDAYNFGIAGDDGTQFYNFWEATGGRATLETDGLLESVLANADTDGDAIGDNVDTDDDGDTMPDNYETANVLDPLNAADAAFDTGGDGYTNLVEYRRRSNPNDANSTPKTVLPWLPLLLN